MTIWTPNLSSYKGPRCRALARAIINDIECGILSPGDRLPPQRILAYRLGLSPNTVMRAYMEVTRRGFIEGAVGRGTYVSAARMNAAEQGTRRAERGDVGPVDFSMNLPFIGVSEKKLEETMLDIVRHKNAHVLLDHYPAVMQLRHRQAAVRWLSLHNLNASVETVMLTGGAQQAIFFALMTLLKPDDVLFMEALSYAPVKEMAHHLGRRTVGITMDEEGISPDALRAACRQYRPRALYFSPTLHTPTTVTMSEHRRRDIAAIAREYDFFLIEDDVFGLLPVDRPNPVATFAPERTIFISSMSKSVAPGLRIGFLHAPQGIVREMENASRLTCWQQPALMAEIAALWIEDGSAETMNTQQRAHAQRRQALAKTWLVGANVQAADEGHHVWLSLSEQWTAESFTVAAGLAGVLVNPASAFAVNRSDIPPAVRLCLSHERTDERVVEGLQKVAALLNSPCASQTFVY